MDLQKMIDSSTPTLVEVFASWCPHCHRMAPIVEDMKEIYAGRVNIVQLDGDKNPKVDEVFEVESYPTFIMYKNGEEQTRTSGEMEASELEALINEYL